MNAEEKRSMLASLEESRQVLSDALAGVTEETARRAPAPGRWTILECVEHLAISEDYFLAQIETATPSDLPQINEKREALIPVRGLDRSRPIECPQEGLPTGRFPTMAGALEHFMNSRARTAQYVAMNESDLRARMTTHPIMKVCNCHEMLLSAAVHVRRHVLQIEEIKGALGEWRAFRDRDL